ncbi:MAG: lactonase family protein [Pirellulales bacterium]|nr:lactonase family protein [Pirellulales bacterium]
MKARLFAPVAAFAVVSLALTQLSTVRAAGPEMLVYVGTYTTRGSEGIYHFRFDMRSGQLEPAGVTKGVKNPSFLAIAPDGQHLYSVAEVETLDGQRAGGVCAFAIERPGGALRKLNQQTSGGAGPCHVSLDRTGRVALVANYGGGSVASLPIDDDGLLQPIASFIQHTGQGPNAQRQEGPHAHSFNVDLNNRFAMAADLGIDRIMVYRLDVPSGRLTANDPPAAEVPPGSGPRHFAFHPSGRFAFTNNELNSTVTGFRYDGKLGVLSLIETLSTLPPQAAAADNTPAEIQVHPSGKFLYVSNRGHNSLAAFKIDADTGKLTPSGHTLSGGEIPRNFGIDPTGAFLLAANQDSGNVVVFRVDAATGALTPTGSVVQVPMAVCVKFLPLETPR